MKHGLIQNQTFAGYELLTPPSRYLTNKIGLTIANTYRFVGYKTSILRHLIDTGDCVVNGKNADGFTVQIQIAEVMKSGSQQIVDSIRGGALGIAGGSVAAVDMMNNVLDGISVAGMIKDMAPDGETTIAPLKRPGKAKYLKDHAMNNRIIVDLSMHKGTRDRWIDTMMEQIDLRTVAHYLQAA